MPVELHTEQHKAAATVWIIRSRAELRVHLTTERHTPREEVLPVYTGRLSWNLKMLWKANAKLYGVQLALGSQYIWENHAPVCACSTTPFPRLWYIWFHGGHSFTLSPFFFPI